MRSDTEYAVVPHNEKKKSSLTQDLTAQRGGYDRVSEPALRLRD